MRRKKIESVMFAGCIIVAVSITAGLTSNVASLYIQSEKFINARLELDITRCELLLLAVRPQRDRRWATECAQIAGFYFDTRMKH